MRRRLFLFLFGLHLISLSCKGQAGFLFFSSATPVSSQNTVTASDLISLINGMRTANGLGALSVDSSLMACAQNTAAVMAQNSMSWHIGDVSGRVSQFGYNNGNRAFATENFMVGPTSLTSIQAAWSDYDHMIPATSSSYCHIGAGVAEANGKTYYVVQAAYPGDKSGCGFSAGSSTSSGSSSTSSSGSVVYDMAQVIASVKIAEPDADGKRYHIVQNGQSLWSIATAYKVTIEDIAAWNNIVDIESIDLGQSLFIPESGSTMPTSTVLPTVLPTADFEGKFRHVIAEGDSLFSIAELWGTTLQDLMRVNGLTEDTTLSLGWRLFIPVTATATIPATMTMPPTTTPLPSLTPSLTPLPSQTPTITPVPITNLPKASPKTYIIAILFFGILGYLIFIAFRHFYSKK